MKKLGLGLMAVSCALLMAGGAADAGTRTNSGLVCMPYNGANIDYFTYASGGVQNTDSVTHAVRCPIENTNTSSTAGLDDFEVYINNAAATSFSCTAYAYSKFSTSQDSTTQSTSSAGERTLDFGAALDVSAVDGKYFFACDITASSYLLSYKVVEP